MRRKERPDYPFDSVKFSKALKKARGDETQACFAGKCTLSYAYLNKYLNCKMTDAPTIGTLKKIAFATDIVSFKDLIEAAGYDYEKYKHVMPNGTSKTDYLSPIIRSIANTSYKWRIDSDCITNNKPIEVIIENNRITRWYFIPVTKREVTKEDIQKTILSTDTFSKDSKLSFVVDDSYTYDRICAFDFPIIAMPLSVILIYGTLVIEEHIIKTNIYSELLLGTSDTIKPIMIE